MTPLLAHAASLGHSVLAGASRRRGGCITAGCVAAALVLGGAGLVGVATAGAIEAVLAPASVSGCAAACAVAGAAPLVCPGVWASQGFGDTPWEHPHTGIDLVCPGGTAVHAVRAGLLHRRNGGTVACLFPAGRLGGLGTYAEVDSGRLELLYGHLSAFAVPDDVAVAAGEVIGYEGDSGCATGVHLHFQVDVDGRAVDPCPLLPAGYPSRHDASGMRCWGSAPP